MYRLRPAGLYMLAEIESDATALERVERMVTALGRDMDEVVRVRPDNVVEAATEIQGNWPPAEVPEGQLKERTRSLAFTRLQLGDEKPDLDEVLQDAPEDTPRDLVANLLGCFPATQRRLREDDQTRNHVCWCAHEFGTMVGCPHGCQYCGAGKNGKLISVAVNVEEFIEGVVEPTLRENPWQKCFRMIGWGSDQITFEPEYGLFDALTRSMSRFEDRYAIIHTASDNVRWIADLPHRDRLICVWSLTCNAVARQIEPAAPSGTERIEAAQFCQRIGVPVRYKFKPIVPIRNWREEYAQTVEELFRETQPESIGLCVLMWMTAEQLKQRIDPALLAPEYVAAMEEAADDMKEVHTGPFPPAVRAEVYRFFIEEVRRWSKEVPIYLSTESRELWDELGPQIGQDKRAFVCGCGPLALPGGGLAVSRSFKYSTYEAKDA